VKLDFVSNKPFIFVLLQGLTLFLNCTGTVDRAESWLFSKIASVNLQNEFDSTDNRLHTCKSHSIGG